MTTGRARRRARARRRRSARRRRCGSSGATSKSPPLVGVLHRERHDEVGLVEVPLQLVAVGHHREVQRAERIGVRDRSSSSPRIAATNARELGPLVQPADRRVGREEVVGDRADVVVAEPLLRVVERERLVGEAEVHRAEPAAAVRERREPARVVDERGQRVGPHERRDLARARSPPSARRPRPTTSRDRPVERRRRIGDVAID